MVISLKGAYGPLFTYISLYLFTDYLSNYIKSVIIEQGQIG